MQQRVGPLLIAGVVFWLLVGLGLYTLVYAQGASYLTNDPAACVDCHVVNEQYNGWLKSNHHTVAVTEPAAQHQPRVPDVPVAGRPITSATSPWTPSSG